jgi:hypothetical protein
MLRQRGAQQAQDAVIADVPDRCIPSTTRAIRFDALWLSPEAARGVA